MIYNIRKTSIETIQAEQDKEITYQIGQNPKLNGLLQALLLRDDFEKSKHNPYSLKNVEINARASQKALDIHGHNMPENIRKELQDTINIVLTENS